MAESPRERRHVLWGIGLAALATFLILSLVTNDPADPVEEPIWPLGAVYHPDVLVYPTHTEFSNACGYWGALVSQIMLTGLGFGSILLVGLIGLVAFKLLFGAGIRAPVLRTLGWTLVGMAFMTSASLANASAEGLSVFGGGGAIGTMTATFLGDQFAPAGSWILTITMLILGLYLSTDYLLVHLGQKVIQQSAKASMHGVQRARSAASHLPRRRVTDVDDGVQLDDDRAEVSEHPAIRIRGKNVDDGPPMVVPALSSDLADEEDVEATSFMSNVAGKVAGALGLGNAPNDSEVEDEWQEDPSDEAYEDEYEDVDESITREVEVDGESRVLRQDGQHDKAGPKIRVPAKSRKEKEPDTIDSQIQETLEEDVDDYMLPAIDLLIESDDVCYDEQAKEVRRKAVILEKTFRNFGFNIRVVEIETGPVIAQYEVELEAGLRLSKITGLADDLAIALRVPSVRIVAPIPGKNTVGIEVPNETRQVVRLRDVIEECGDSSRRMQIPIFLGKDVSGNSLAVDLAKMPHLLIAGRTGTGKSVCLNAIISSILMTRRPDEVRMLMIDPKMVELSGYGRLPHLMHPVVTDMKKAEAILGWAVEKMEERYSLLAQVGVRHITSYNELGRDELARRMGAEDPQEVENLVDHLPFIVIVADEMADLMMTAGKEVEQHIIRLAQKSRAVGIHLILATQKPTVDVITGLIKSNLPARIAFQVASRTDSRVVLDENGADKLLGNGDMLFLWPGTSTLLRGQGTFLSDDEIQRVCDHCGSGEQNFVGELMELKVQQDEESEGSGGTANFKKRDELYESAVDVVVREGRGSCSLLQRALGIGYGRAARLIDFMAEDGIVGQYNGSQAREVIMTVSEWEAMQGIEPTEDEEAPAEEPAANSRRNTITRGDGWDDATEEEYEDDEEDEYEEYEEYEEVGDD